MRPDWAAMAALLSLVCGLAGCSKERRVKQGEEKAVATIERLNGSFGVDESDPEKPIIRVSLGHTSATDADLAVLKDLSKLQQLTLGPSFGNVSDEGLAHLKGITTLRLLKLGDTKITDAGLVHLKQMSNLAELNLQNTQITDAGLEHLKGLANLKKLNVGGCPITANGVRDLRKALPKLSIDPPYLALTAPEYQVGGTARRDPANPKGPVAWLNLGGAEVTDAGFGHHLKQLPGLRTIYLSDTQVTNSGLLPLATQSQLRVLHLSLNRHLGDGGLVHLAGLTGLEELHLTSTPVSDAGLANLAKLAQLKTLSLGRTKVAGPGLRHLSGMSRLESLNLCGTPVTDAGLAHLSGLSSLEYLWLADTTISDAGLAHLKGLILLKVLDLRHTSVSDKGLKELAGLTNLQRLSLEGAKTTNDGMKELKSALPNAELRR